MINEGTLAVIYTLTAGLPRAHSFVNFSPASSFTQQKMEKDLVKTFVVLVVRSIALAAEIILPDILEYAINCILELERSYRLNTHQG